MLNDPRFMPVLNRGDWRGIGAVYTRPLVDASDPAAGVVLSLGVVSVTTNAYLTLDQVKSFRIDTAAAELQALSNLAGRTGRVDWEASDSGCPLLYRNGDELTCSEVLLRDEMAAVNEHFSAELVYAAVPNRFTLVVGADAQALTGLAASMHEEAVQENTAPLTGSLLVVAAGGIVGVATMPGQPQSEPVTTVHLSEDLIALPLAAFLAVALTNGGPSQQQIGTFMGELQKRAQSASPAVAPLLFATVENIQASVARFGGGAHPLNALTSAVLEIEAVLPDPGARQEYVRVVETCARLGAPPAKKLFGKATTSPQTQKAVETVIDVLKMVG